MPKRIIIPVLVALVAVAGYFGFLKEQTEDSAAISKSAGNTQENKEPKTFVFKEFHGNTDISDTFRFQYPAHWFNDGQYFSPQRVEYYTKYEVRAPIYFDLILAKIFDFTELKYQIDNSKRRSPDTVGTIDGREFKRYDLTDYGTYGGDSAGRVKIFLGPTIRVGDDEYYLVFHWEERPLGESIPGNDVGVFDDMLLTLKFSR